MSGIQQVIALGPLPVSVYNGAVASRSHSGFGSPTHVLFNSDGTVTSSGAGSIEDTGLPSYWFSMTLAGIGASYWVRSTYQSGDALTLDPSAGTWISLAAGQDWDRDVPLGTIKTNVTKFEISNSAAGTTILASGNITITGDAT